MDVEMSPRGIAQELSGLFKALAEPKRLRILGLLVEEPRTGEELSHLLGIGAPTVSHHMRRLVDAGLVTAEKEQYYQVYSLRPGALARMARMLDERLLAKAAASKAGEDESEAKVLRDFFKGERLKAIPRQRKKRVVVLRHLTGRFEPGRAYTEADVNEVLARAHEDVATLRREMVGSGLLGRAMGEYWRV